MLQGGWQPGNGLVARLPLMHKGMNWLDQLMPSHDTDLKTEILKYRS